MSYVPRILLCGDVESFRSAAGDMAVDIVGQISFTGSPECGENYIFLNADNLAEYKPTDLHIFLNGEEISGDELRKILDGVADYIVFDSEDEFAARHNDLYSLKIFGQFISREALFRQARHNFYLIQNLDILPKLLRNNKIFRLLDVDAFFVETDFFMFSDLFPTVDGIIKNPKPIHENFYRKIYATLVDCRFKFYDALLIAERSPQNFIDTLIETNDLAEKILIFARKNTELENFLTVNENIFEKVSRFPALNGNWYLIQKRVQKDFCVYVVTHKDAKLDALPEGYKIIHAGHAQAKEKFGYLGDDTGDNISHLNLYLNEVTALYWLWKNTSHNIIGLNHYRRFFTAKDNVNSEFINFKLIDFDIEKILSREEAEEILSDYDIIVAENFMSRLPTSCYQKLLIGYDLEPFVEKIFKKHIARRQPNYLEAFDYVAKGYTNFQYEIFITRRNIFDVYCEWLFSFLLDVMEEVFARTNIKQIDNPRKYRVVGIFSERLMTVWLIKNRLRIKKLPVMFREDI